MTMKKLYILRHAKSSWDDSSLSDFDRPLNDRGLKSAPFMGELIARKQLIPDVILSSPAARAKRTAELVKKAAGIKADLKFDERVYEASPQALLHVVSEIDEQFASAMVVGHNPGMEGFIRVLTGKLEPMPTAALAVIELDIDNWSSIAPGSGTLETIIRPKDEMKSKGKAN